MLRRGETQALLIITHSGTVKGHLLQAQRAPDILCICTISISCGQSESYSHRLTIYTLSRQRLCGKKSCKGFTDLLVLVGIFREKNREPDLKLQLQITVGVCVSFIVYQCVAYGSPQPAPSALWHTHMLQSSFLSLTSPTPCRCHHSCVVSHVYMWHYVYSSNKIWEIKYLNCLFYQHLIKYWMFPHLHTEATGQSKACEPLSVVTAASTDKRALWHHHFLCFSCILLTDTQKRKTAEMFNSVNTQETTGENLQLQKRCLKI